MEARCKGARHLEYDRMNSVALAVVIASGMRSGIERVSSGPGHRSAAL